ncbi:MAG: hypothetical protein JSS45_10915 [Proteobacteria bacterium]|nr:hypothetical protein [Pseudomonadota bacterium]
MSSNYIPASELPPASAVWVTDLTPEGRAGLDRFLGEHAKHYSGHPTELERWINQGVLDAFAENIRAGQPFAYTLAKDAAKDGQEHVFAPAAADVLCEALQNPF